MTDFSVVCQPSGPLSDTVFRILRVSHTSGMSSTFLPLLYEKMLSEAERKGLRLTGFVFETGMNDFAIADDGEYITKVFIRIADEA